MNLKILGMDPSLSNFGIVHATLNIETLKITPEAMYVLQTEPEKDKKVRKLVRKNSEDLDRCKILHKGAVEATEGRFLAFIEVPVGSQSSRAMASYGVSLGVIAAVANAMPIIQLTPTEVKVAGCGIKTATKGEMIDAMVAKYPNAPWPRYTQNGKGYKKGDIHAGEGEHVADALAAIEAGIATDEFRRMIAVFRATPLANHILKAA
jgi:Holliday junction resolvasome RuvABC endonuclease subunit